MSFEEDDNYLDTTFQRYGRRAKLLAPPGVHVPNKNEAKMLRKLKSQTGLTESELREEKKYRKMLSDAQQRKGSKTAKDRAYRDLLKKITRELKLPKEHPEVTKALTKIWNEKYRTYNY